MERHYLEVLEAGFLFVAICALIILATYKTSDLIKVMRMRLNERKGSQMEAEACSCGDYDFEPCEVGTHKKVRARKEHTCDECASRILPGSYYYYITTLMDSRWESMKRCIPCQQIANDYFCGVIGKGAVREYCWNHLGVDLKTGKTKEDTP